MPGVETAAELASAVRHAVVPEDPIAARLELKRVCDAGDFEARVSRLPKYEALLMPRRAGGFTICVDPSKGAVDRRDTRRHRIRFRVAHEIAHSFFYDREAAPPQRLLPATAEEEGFCDAFASRLLVPPEVAREQRVGAASISRLSIRYDVSLRATAHALCQAHPGTTVLYLRWGRGPRHRAFGMRILWSISEAFVPTSVRLQSAAVEAAREDSSAEVVEDLHVGGLRGRFRVSAECYRGKGQMFVVIRPPEMTAECSTGQDRISRPFSEASHGPLRIWHQAVLDERRPLL